MSMENAILVHASALRELGQAMKDAAMMNAEVAKLNGEVARAQARQVNAVSSFLTPEADLEDAVSKVEKDAALDKAVEAGAKTKAALKAEQDKYEASVKKEMQEQEKQLAEKAAAEMAAQDLGENQTPAIALDYKADVVPALLALQKKTGGLKDLLTKFGVTKGDQLKAEQYADIVAQANKLAA